MFHSKTWVWCSRASSRWSTFEENLRNVRLDLDFFFTYPKKHVACMDTLAASETTRFRLCAQQATEKACGFFLFFFCFFYSGTVVIRLSPTVLKRDIQHFEFLKNQCRQALAVEQQTFVQLGRNPELCHSILKLWLLTLLCQVFYTINRQWTHFESFYPDM